MDQQGKNDELNSDQLLEILTPKHQNAHSN